MFWMMIVVLALVLGAACLWYLARRFSRFTPVRNLAGRLAGATGTEPDGRAVKRARILAWVLGACILAALAVIFLLTMGYVNALIIALYLALFLLVSDGIVAIIRRVAHRDVRADLAGALAIAVTVTYFAVGCFCAYHVWTTTYEVTTQKDVAPLKIVQFADSHVGTTFHADGFSDLVDRMQAEEPDVVFITGDFVDDDTTREDMLACCEALGRFRTPYGVYFVFGNHDKGYYGDEHRGWTTQELVDALTANGVTVLEDAVVPIGEDYLVIGRQDRSEAERGNPRATMAELTEGLDDGRYQIVLDHQPNDYTAEAESGVDLVLSGHTHGGQLIPITYVGIWTGQNDAVYGYEKRLGTDFIVTSGISDWAIKFKTGCISEYCVISVGSGD